MTPYLWIAAGSAVGGMARHWCGVTMATAIGGVFPWGTLLVNVLGSLAIGAFAALTGPAGRLPVSESVQLFVMVGLCGGYTTFSAFSLQTLELLRLGRLPEAGGYILGSVALCLLAVWLGYAAAMAAGGR